MQRAILRDNFFVEKLIPNGTARALSHAEIDHYRAVQPTPDARRGVAEFLRQIRAARRWLAEVSRGVETALARKPLLLTWGMRDFALRAAALAGRTGCSSATTNPAKTSPVSSRL